MKNLDSVKTAKVAIVGTVGLPAKYGGWETLTSNLVDYLSQEFELTVFCSSKKYPDKIAKYNGANLEYIDLEANGVQSIPYDVISIYRSLKFADTILVLGVSGCAFLPFLKLLGNSNVVVNIDGLEWKRAKWGRLAKWFLKFSERIAVRYADTVITDNKAIQDYLLEEYAVRSRLIAYGGDHTGKCALEDKDRRQYNFLNSEYAFTVCRIEPENNLDVILEAFVEYNSMPIVIVGNWLNSAYGIELRKKYQRHSDIYMLDPIYNQREIDVIRSNCYYYVHGHSAGGTNPSLVEAMYLGLPVIAFDISYNRETTHNKALYFDSKDGLVKALCGIEMSDLLENSKNMKLIADKNYTWDVITRKYAHIF